MEIELQQFNEVFQDPLVTHPSDYALISYCHNEPESNQRLTLEKHLNDCSHCRQRLEQMSEQQKVFNETTMFDEIQKRLVEHCPKAQPDLQAEMKSAGRRGFPMWPALVTASAIAILIIFTLVHPHLQGNKVIDDSKTRSVSIKGVNVVWAVKRGERQLNADQFFRFQIGDRIGFQITASRSMYAMVVSVDHQGNTRPLTSKPVMVAALKKTVLPLSLLIQPPFETERIFVILTSGKLTTREVVRSIGAEFSRLESAGNGIHEMTSLQLKGHVESRLIEIR